VKAIAPNSAKSAVSKCELSAKKSFNFTFSFPAGASFSFGSGCSSDIENSSLTALLNRRLTIYVGDL
jgi:hypothetical protein